MRRVALALTLFAASACGGADEGPVGTTRAAVVFGEPDVPPRYDATILIRGPVLCTGTLISPHVAVTARHCVSSFEKGVGFGANFRPSELEVFYGAEPRAERDNVVVRIVHNGEQPLGDNDLALIVLERAATAVPFAAVRLSSEPQKGEAVAVAGYGVTDTGTVGERYRREDLSVHYVGPIITLRLGERELMIGESVCRGDSGGPLYARASSALIAISSRGSNGQPEDAAKPWTACVGSATINYYTRTDSFAALIRATVHEVGERTWEEGKPRPEQPNVTVVACTDTASCEAGRECRDGFCLRLPEPEPAPADPAAPPPKTTDGGCAIGRRATASGATLVLALALLALRRRH